MSSSPDGWAIRAQGLGKRYPLFTSPGERFRQALLGREPRPDQQFWALQEVGFEVAPGEVFGIVGRNGAGKSTLLQLVSRILRPTTGTVTAHGRIAALLELGSGFNPEFTGRENVFMNAAILGLTREETRQRLDDILAFADIGRFVDQPVKTYSSGMFVRLAFAIATSVDPDILIVDEALSVGDGAFARKSFDRIMALREAGKTVLLCSHSLYHIEAICSRVLWLEGGRQVLLGPPEQVLPRYGASLEADRAPAPLPQAAPPDPGATPGDAPPARILGITAQAGDTRGLSVRLDSGATDLTLEIRFASDPRLPPPTIGIGLDSATGVVLATVSSLNDGVVMARDGEGRGVARVTFPRIALLRGAYTISVFLACERMLHVYEQAARVVQIEVTQSWLEPGLVTLPHRWHEEEMA